MANERLARPQNNFTAALLNTTHNKSSRRRRPDEEMEVLTLTTAPKAASNSLSETIGRLVPSYRNRHGGAGGEGRFYVSCDSLWTTVTNVATASGGGGSLERDQTTRGATPES